LLVSDANTTSLRAVFAETLKAKRAEMLKAKRADTLPKEIFMTQLVSMLLLFLLPAPTIVVNVQLESGAAIVGLPVAFRQEGGGLTGQCVSDENGRCEIPLVGEVAEGQIIRGVLDFGPSGVRSLIWMVPEMPEAIIILDTFGKVAIPGHHVHPTPETFSDISPTPLPLVEAESTAIPLATTEYVVIDPSAAEPTLIPLDAPTAVVDLIPEASPVITAIVEDESVEQKRPLGLIITVNLLFVALWIGGTVYLWRKKDA
jgi:hypothetical protein